MVESKIKLSVKSFGYCIEFRLHDVRKNQIRHFVQAQVFREIKIDIINFFKIKNVVTLYILFEKQNC